ncbi:peptide chain release factor N(5)-glutamine methyltransferase [Elusimicrobiota bacterium]
MKPDVKTLVNTGTVTLEDNNIESPELESELLLRHVLKLARSDYFSNLKQLIEEKHVEAFKDLLNMRCAHKPIAYILGSTEFMGLKMKVDENTLIPRPETEILVENVLKYDSSEFPEIIDLGTGSGNIAVSLAFLGKYKVTAVEINSRAIEVAKTNACRHNVDDRIVFLNEDMLGVADRCIDKYDILVSNPPYVMKEDYLLLQEEIKQEPVSALLAENSGLFFILYIIENIQRLVRKKGLFFLEFGYNQKEAIEKAVNESRYISDYSIIKDYNNMDRILTGNVI